MDITVLERPTPVVDANAEELSVNVLNTKRFTPTHLKTLKGLRNIRAYPRIYGDKAPRGIKYVSTEIISTDLIDPNNDLYSQLARVTMNPRYVEIEGDIKANGYSLTEIPIAVFRLPNGRYVIGEGRTRYDILLGYLMENVIVDVFDAETPAAALRFAVAQNAQKKPYGAASSKDIRKAVLELIKYGEIDQAAPNFKDLVVQEIMGMTTKITPSELNQIVHDAEEYVHGETQVISFPNGRGTDKWLQRYRYFNTADREFMAIGTFTEKNLLSCIRKLSNLPSSVKVVDLVVHGGTLDSKDPEGDWLKKCKDFDKEFYSKLENISKVFFGGAKMNFDRIRLYGAIPMVKALEEKYPMDELYLFPTR